MDTRRVHGSGESRRRSATLGTETVPFDLVELVELRYAVTGEHQTGLGSIAYAFALLGVLAVIAILAIATSSGWSILIR